MKVTDDDFDWKRFDRALYGDLGTPREIASFMAFCRDYTSWLRSKEVYVGVGAKPEAVKNAKVFIKMLNSDRVFRLVRNVVPEFRKHQ